MLTTFGTPFGRFRYLRMPFGINTASEVYFKEQWNSCSPATLVRSLSTTY
jgi:hypothetical protein